MTTEPEGDYVDTTPNPHLKQWYKVYGSVIGTLLPKLHTPTRLLNQFLLRLLDSHSEPEHDFDELKREASNTEAQTDDEFPPESNRRFHVSLSDSEDVAYADSTVIADTLPMNVKNLVAKDGDIDGLVSDLEEIAPQDELTRIGDGTRDDVEDGIEASAVDVSQPQEVDAVWNDSTHFSWDHHRATDTVNISLYPIVTKKVRLRVFVRRDGVLGSLIPNVSIEQKFIPDSASDTPTATITGDGDVEFVYEV